MKIKIHIILLVLSISSSVLSKVVVYQGLKYKTNNIKETQFINHLIEEKIELEKTFEDLYFPSIFENLEMFWNMVDSHKSTYKNRELQCNFLISLAEDVKGTDFHKELLTLTNQLKICVVGDVPLLEQKNWSIKLMNLFYEKNWIFYKGTYYSIKDYLEENFDDPGVKSPSLKWLNNEHVEGHGFGVSLLDKGFGSDDLKLIFETVSNFDLNSNHNDYVVPEFISSFMTEKTTFKEVFAPSDDIYISSWFGPTDLVEALVHEVGHTFINQLQRHWYDFEGDSVFHLQGQQDEGFAENFTWVMLKDLYKEYPQLKYFHIGKLYFFSQVDLMFGDIHFKGNTDPHYIGAYSGYEIMKNTSEPNQELKNWAKTKTFYKYINNLVPNTLLESDEELIYCLDDQDFVCEPGLGIRFEEFLINNH